jgi:hypothetical protein
LNGRRTGRISRLLHILAETTNSGKWTANITSGSPSLFPAIEPSAGAIDGHSRDDMLVNAKLFIDGMLGRSSAA